MSANIKTWQERVDWLNDRPALALKVDAMKAKIADLRAALAAKAVHDGWKMVPKEPTDDMVVAFSESWFSKVRCIDDPEMDDAYASMLAAAPSPADQEKGD